MSERKEVFIEGVSMEISWADRTRSLTELIFDTTTKAVEDAGQGWDGINSVVLASYDLVDGRSLSSMVTAPAAGAYLRDEVRYSDDSAGALAAAIMRVEAGEAERSVVAAWGRAAEHDVDELSRALFDRIYLSPLGLEEITISAFNAQRWAIDGGDKGATRLAAARREAAVRANPRALKHGGKRSRPSYPIEEAHLPVWADVAVAVVISAKPSKVKLKGLGLASEPYWPGDRVLASAPALRSAAQRALDDAGVSIDQIDLFELDGLTLFDEAIALEAVGRASKGQGMRVLAEDPRCNASGGGLAGYCAPAMGLARVVEASLQLQGQAGGVQQGKPKLALASGSSVVAGQTQTVVVLEAV